MVFFIGQLEAIEMFCTIRVLVTDLTELPLQ